jgi:hypothetical protein
MFHDLHFGLYIDFILNVMDTVFPSIYLGIYSDNASVTVVNAMLTFLFDKIQISFHILSMARYNEASHASQAASS